MKVSRLVDDYRELVDGFSQQEFIDKIDFIGRVFADLNVAPDIGEYEKLHAKRLYLTNQLIEDALSEVGEGDVADLGATFASMAMWRKASPTAKLYLSLAPQELEVLMRENYQNFEGFVLDLEKELLPIASESVVAVGLFEVIEHFYIDPMHCLSEVNRILKNGGKFLITTPNICSWRALTAIITGYEPYLYGKFCGPESRRHVHEFSTRNLKILLEAAGFEVEIRTENLSCNGVSQSVTDLLNELGAPTDDRGDAIIAVATKKSSILRRYPEEIYDVSVMEHLR